MRPAPDPTRLHSVPPMMKRLSDGMTAYAPKATATVFTLIGLVSAWIGVVFAVNGGLCDNDGHCYALPDAVGRSVPWELFAAAALGVATVFLFLAALSFAGRLSSRQAALVLGGGLGVCLVHSVVLYSLSNVFYDGGEPYRTGDRELLLVAVPLLPALGAALLIVSDLRR
ncbi:MAG: hypothetical protein QOF68_1210 [Gaiellales bacterium]|nr:hypothetical protein [Gaiellales bacterium]